MKVFIYAESCNDDNAENVIIACLIFIMKFSESLLRYFWLVKGELNPKINLFLKHCTKYEKQVFKGFSLLWCVVVENFYFKTSNISLGTAAQIWAVSGFLMSSWRHTWGSVLACFTRVLRRFVKMVYCMACKCSNDSRKTKNISYHRLPRDKSLKKVWLVKISRENVKDTEDTVLYHDFQVTLFNFETSIFCGIDVSKLPRAIGSQIWLTAKMTFSTTMRMQECSSIFQGKFKVIPQ